MPVRPLLCLATALCLLALSSAASATTLYKWVDERGVTHYSDQPPAASAKRQPIAENRVSVYTPDPQLLRAIEAERARALEDLRTGRRARELQAEWLARQYFAALRATPYDPCAGDPQCGASLPFAYAPAASSYAARRGLRVLPQIDLAPGTTAGNVTAGEGYMPGYSAFVPGTLSTAPRVMPAPEVRRDGTRDGRRP